MMSCSIYASYLLRRFTCTFFVGTTTTPAVRLSILAFSQVHTLISWLFLLGKAHEIFGQDVAALLNATIW